MSNGEKLPPQDVEFALLHDPVFEQVMLVGEGRPFLTLLAVTKETDEQSLVKRANEKLKSFPRWVRIRRVIPMAEAVEHRERAADTHAETQAPAGAGKVQGRRRCRVRCRVRRLKRIVFSTEAR